MKRLFLFMLAIALGCLASAYAETELALTDGFTLPVDRWDAIAPYGEEGLFVIGSALNDSVGDRTPVAAYLDRAGNEILLAELPEELGRLTYVVPLSNGGYAMYRDTSNEEGLGREVIIIQEGKVVFQEEIQNRGNRMIWPQILPARDGFFLVYGERHEKDKRGGTFHVPALEKKDNEGKTQWRYVFDNHELQFQGAVPVEGGHVLFGSMEEQATGQRHNISVIAKMSDAGELMWITQGKDYEEGYGNAVVLPDGSLLVTGSRYRRTDGPGLENWGILARYSAEGEMLWKKDYKWDGIDAFGFGEIHAVEGGYLILAGEIDYKPPLHLLLVNDGGEETGRWIIQPIDDKKYGRVEVFDQNGTYCLLVEVMRDDFSSDQYYWVDTGMKLVR